MTVTKKGLGKGLDALFSDNAVQLAAEEEKVSGAAMVRIGQIEPNPAQPRRTFDEQKLEELTASITEHGVIQPLLVRRIADDRYQIVAGERRWRAARRAKLAEVPVIVAEYTDRQVAEIALVENLQREDLNPVEQAKGFQALMEEYELTQEEVSQRVGCSRPAVANALRLLTLPEPVQDLLAQGELSAGHARALVVLGDQAVDLAQRIVREGLSVRHTESLAKKAQHQKEKPTKQEEIASQTDTVDYYAVLARELGEKLGRKVSVLPKGKKGKLELDYYSAEDLETLVSELSSLH